MELEFYKKKKMQHNIEDEEFTLNSSYCTVHGDDLDVLESDNGDLYVSLKDIKRAGFHIFRKESFNSMLVDRRLINEEFELHLLSEAKNYIFQNKTMLDEKTILKTIENCKKNILGYTRPEPSQLLPNRKIVRNHSNIEATSPISNQDRINTDSEIDTSSKYAIRPPKSIPETSGGKRIIQNGRLFDGNNMRNNNQNHQPRQDNRNYGGKDLNRSFDNVQRGRACFTPQSGRIHSRDQNGIRTDDENFDKNSLYDDKGNSSDSSSRVKNRTKGDFIPRMTLTENVTQKVKVTHHEKGNIYWVQLEETLSELNEMQKEIQSAASGLHNLNDPRTSQFTLALFKNNWYRGRIYTEEPLTVRYLDFGFQHHPEALKPLPDKFKKTPIFAARAVINNIDDSILEKNKVYNIIVKKKYENNNTYVANVEQDDANAHRSRDSARFRANSVMANDNADLEDENNEMKHTTKSRSSYDRNADNSKTSDRSRNSSRFSEGKENETVRSRSRSAGPTNKNDDDLNTSDSNVQVFVGSPPPLDTLKDGQEVIICGIDGNTLLIKTKECCKRSKELTEYIKGLDKSQLHLKSVKKNQLVLCSKDDLPNLCRAIVYDMEGAIVRVNYVDYPGDEQLSLKSLRNVDAFLAKEPMLLLKSPPCNFLNDPEKSVLDFIVNLIEKKTRVVVVVTDDTFDIELSDKSLLSEKIVMPKSSVVKTESEPVSKSLPEKDHEKIVVEETKAKPTPTESLQKKEEVVTPAPIEKETKVDEGPIFFDDMKVYNPNMGKSDYLVYAINALDDVTFISLNEDSMEYFTQLTPINVENKEPYEPEEMEMCLVAIKENGEENWYRATVIGKENDDDFSVLCVDFGNQENVKKESLRKYPMDLKDIPILGISCTLSDVPHNEKILNKVKELLVEGDQIEMNIEEYIEDSFKYKVQIPSVRQQLTDSGLL